MHEETFFRMLTLELSDIISSKLKLNFDIKNLSCIKTPYSELVEPISEHSFCGLFRLGKRGMVVFIDPRIIYKLSNRMLGGKGIIEKKIDPVYTDSELFLGKEILETIQRYYEIHNVELEFVRYETNIKLVHYFFPEEKIFGAKCDAKIHDEESGILAICHPIED